MFPKEIVEILEKYQEINVQELNNINKDIKDIIVQLKSIRKHLFKQVSDLIDIDSADSKEDELLQDLKSIRNYINTIYTIKITNNLTLEVSEEITFPTNPFKDCKEVRLFLCLDNLCPTCNCNMNETNTIYSHMSSNSNLIYNKKIDTYVCPCCHRFFVTKDTIDTISIDKTNIKLLKDFYDEIPDIDIYSVIVLSNTLKCSVNHRTNDVRAKIPVLTEHGEITYIKINASYCFDCNRFTILKDDFNKIKDIVMCKIIDETGNSYNNENDFEIEQKQSILFQYGYNVQTKKNLSTQQRQIILSSLIESGIMDRRDIINHINTLIDRGSKIPNWNVATQKWKEDRQFVSDYKTGDIPEIIFNKIVLKYKTK